FEQDVAVKIIQPFGLNREEQMNRLRTERQILANLQHPNIARVFDGGITPEGWPYMVMELVDGMPLTRYCNDNKLGLNERLHLFQTICDAVSYAHQNLVLHRDLKPGNILVTKNGQVKLLDFGIAKLLTDDQTSAPLTRTGMPLLTPEYAAPEQFRGGNVATPIDVYSLGVILYELLSGARPFDLSQKSFNQMEQVICEEEPKKPSEKAGLEIIQPGVLTGDLDTICLKALRKEPGNRYTSVQDLKKDLLRYQNGIPVSARPANRSYRIKKFISRHKTSVSVTVIGIMLIIGFIAVLLYQQQITIQERDRAISLTEQVQAELERSNTLRDFLTDLFRANIPDRPRDELPTTEELLEYGTDRALDPESGNNLIRADMLTVIASIYQQHNQLEKALELTDTAINLLNDGSSEYSKQLSDAYRLHSGILLRQRDIRQAEHSLMLANRWLPPGNRTEEAEFRLRLDLSRLRMNHGEYLEAKELLEPLVTEIKSGHEVSSALMTRLMWDMAIIYNNLHEFENALDTRYELLNLTKSSRGATSLHYAVALANTALTEIQLGKFNEASQKLSEALGLYDSIYEEKPSEYRGAALHSLARLQRYKGLFNDAIVTARLSSEQWAAATERTNLDEYVWLHFGQAQVLVSAQQWQNAIDVLMHTHGLVLTLDPPRPGTLIWVEASIAQYHCRKGDISRGVDMIREINSRLEPEHSDFMTTDDYLALFESAGVCAASEGRWQDAIDAFQKALALPIPPGQFADIARFKIQTASAYGKSGQFEIALTLLNDAETELTNGSPIRHPYMDLHENVYSKLSPVTITEFAKP
ncbi:MAG: serine/threonine protein kinase, partial [Balneolaceae bacterium]